MYIALMSINSWQNSRFAEQENIFFISASKKRVRRTTLIDKKASKFSDGYIVQGIAILANECLESSAGASIMLMLIDSHT